MCTPSAPPLNIALQCIGPSGRGRMVIAITSIALTGIIISAIMTITFIVITIDVTSGPDQMKP